MIKANRRLKNSSWKVAIAKENNRPPLPRSLLNDEKKLSKCSVKRSRRIGIIAKGMRFKAFGKSASWVIPAALSSNKSKMLHGISIHGRRHMSWFPYKTLHLGRTNLTRMMNEHLQTHSNMLCNKTTRSKLRNLKPMLRDKDDFSSKFPSIEEPRGFTSICANSEKGNLQPNKIMNDIFRQSSALNVNYGYEAKAHYNRNNTSTSKNMLNITEAKDWIQRMYSNIKFTFRDLHVAIWSQSDGYSLQLENIPALCEPIPVADVTSDSTVLFARKDSKSKIRQKIEEFCKQRKDSLTRKSNGENICNKRERSCTTKKDICQREKPEKKEKSYHDKKKPDCSRPKYMVAKHKKVVCAQKKNDKSEIHDCSGKKEAREQPCTRRKDDTCKKSTAPPKVPPCTQPKVDICKPTWDSCKDTSKPDSCRTILDDCEDKPCTKPKDHICKSILDSCEDESCTKPKDKPCKSICDTCDTCYKEKEKNFCTESGDNECRKSVYKKYSKSDQYKRDKKCWQDKDEKISCKQEVRRECQEVKKTVCEGKKKEEKEKHHDCTEIKKTEPSKKKECSTVVKAPDCPEDNEKKRGS